MIQTYDLQIDNLPMIRKVVASRSRHLPFRWDDDGYPVNMFACPPRPDVRERVDKATGEILSEIVPNGFWVECPSWSNQHEQPVHWLKVSHPKLAVRDGDARVAAFFPCSCQDRVCRLKPTHTLAPSEELCKHQRRFLQEIWPAICWHLLDGARRQIQLGMEGA